MEIASEQPAGARVHDVGTGAGAIALALLDERPDLQVTANDPYEAAAAVARENAERLGLPLEVTDEFGLPEGDYDLVVANLPYIPEGDWDLLQPEIRRYEPREASCRARTGWTRYAGWSPALRRARGWRSSTATSRRAASGGCSTTPSSFRTWRTRSG